ncbi:MAG: fumarylacetoacetate hydrolase family protein [Bacteroidia bacterium]|nr:fumarylacetoacetate hydrolase family protein [Bacteroidia bacterium]
MKLLRWGLPGEERPGLLDAQGIRRDAAAFGEDYDERFFAADGLARLRAWAGDMRQLPLVPEDARLGPPVGRPSKLICVGLNYADHARETNARIPAEPILFFKSTTAICGPSDPLILPKGSEKTDWEVELCVVIGKRASYVSEAAAMDHVAGYLLHNDYSERAYQLERGGQWVKGKSCDTFAPLGPWMATADEITDPQQLDMWLTVNGQYMQRSSSAEMIFGVRFLVSYISQFMTLLPGDLISTGTPAGVALGMNPPPYLRAGDRVRLGVAGLGESEQEVRAWGA